MTDPLICCLLPCSQNERFVERAIRSFQMQSYWPKELLIWDMGLHISCDYGDTGIIHAKPHTAPSTVGAIRNEAIASPDGREASIIAHFDYDDWSAPQRLQYQLDFMRSTGVPVVGFSDMCFYDAVRDRVLYYDSRMTNYALGTSLFYKREVWERVKFPDITPEDTTWQHQVGHDNIRGCSSIVDGKPMMIQVLHGANAAASASGAIFEPATKELDAEVRRILSVA